jgi:hypothetical protein
MDSHYVYQEVPFSAGAAEDNNQDQGSGSKSKANRKDKHDESNSLLVSMEENYVEMMS